jgi:hypothetical protein
VLTNNGFVIGAIRTVYSTEIPANGISGTDPPPRTSVSRGSTVKLDLSKGPEPNWTQYIPTTLFAVLGLVVLGVIVFIVTKDGQIFLSSLAKKEVARGLITFLIAISTVGIAIILAVSTLVLAEGDAGDRRFDRGKQILTTLIGVLGTIVGFYFGSENAPDNQQTQPPRITTASLPDGTVGKPYTSTTLETAGLKPPLTWTIKPGLPSGLALDTALGIISGTPTKVTPRTPFTFTVTDSSTPTISTSVDLQLEIK